MPRAKKMEVIPSLGKAFNQPLERIDPYPLWSDAEKAAHDAAENIRLGKEQTKKLDLVKQAYGLTSLPWQVRGDALALHLCNERFLGFQVLPDPIWDFFSVRHNRKNRAWSPRQKKFLHDFVVMKQRLDPKMSVASICEFLCTTRDPELGKPARARELAAHTKTLVNVFTKIARAKRAN
jgi:hypothetical protein